MFDTAVVLCRCAAGFGAGKGSRGILVKLSRFIDDLVVLLETEGTASEATYKIL